MLVAVPDDSVEIDEVSLCCLLLLIQPPKIREVILSGRSSHSFWRTMHRSLIILSATRVEEIVSVLFDVAHHFASELFLSRRLLLRWGLPSCGHR